MKLSPSSLPLLLFLFLVSSSFSSPTSAQNHQNFLRCLSLYPNISSSVSKVLYTPRDSNYSSLLSSSIYNLRFSGPSTPKPSVIVTPTHVSHIQATIRCARRHALQIRTRSGGHDFEGLSYVAPVPFVVIDLINLRSIDVDVRNQVAWIQTGATLGEVYYNIAQKSKTLAFPAGMCPTVGSGGHISGGGYGALIRKYGMAADNVIDALVVDVNGRILDRKSMGEDLFWAIRGGGGASFGVILAWKLKLVPVPSTVTVFTVARTLEQNATRLVHQWQTVANKLPEDAFMDLFIRSVNATQDGTRTIQATFNCMFLGGADNLVSLMQERFPELGISKNDCSEMSWIESVVRIATFPSGTPLEILLDRSVPIAQGTLKVKSDYVQEPIPEFALEALWKKLHQQEAETVQLGLVAYGGKMAEISETATPYAHRSGYLYKMQYLVTWEEEGMEASLEHLSWSRALYRFMTPYVSKSPRAAYINYRDLDIGANNEGYTSYEQASSWGFKYFKNNFNRLVQVKARVDPGNFFRNEQSIPPVHPSSMKG